MNLPFEYENIGNTLSTIPSRHFCFIVDPDVSRLTADLSKQGVFKLIHDLRGVSPDIDLRFLLPSYLSKVDQTALTTHLSDSLIVLEQGNGLQTFIPSERFSKKAADKLNTDPNKAHISGLLALAVAIQADGVITSSDMLVDLRWAFRTFERIRIIPPEELGDIIEIIAHGNNLFWSASHPDRILTVDLYYPMTNLKCHEYLDCVADLAKMSTDAVLNEELHNALINRYPFLCYARDLVRFYELQLDHYWRRGLQQRFNFPLGYHVTHFYLMLWGMLDQLTVIAKHACKLKLRTRECGIRKKCFLSAIEKIYPNLKDYLESERISKWISHIADIRHQAAHQTIPLPKEVLQETEESKKDEADIRTELKENFAEMYAYFPAEYIKQEEPIWIQNWRISRMKRLANTSVLIRKENGGGYLYDPVVSLDSDLTILTEIIDKHLLILFGYPKTE
jgi:predicted nucleic acid-binding protein